MERIVHDLNIYPKHRLARKASLSGPTSSNIKVPRRAMVNSTSASPDLDAALPGSTRASEVPEDTSSVGRAVGLVAHSRLAGGTLLVATEVSSLDGFGSLDERLNCLNGLGGQSFCDCQQHARNE